MSSGGIIGRALSSLGKGFDLTSDFQLKYCKGNDRLVLLNETQEELLVPGFGSFTNVSTDIKCGKGDRTRYQSDILDFSQMSEFINRKCSVTGRIPSGLFNSMFEFSGSWAKDAANIKYLGVDGYYVLLSDLHIDRYSLVPSDEVRNAVPSTWDPSALARFVEKYGTHIIVGLGIGGHDIVVLKQGTSSNLEPSQLKNYWKELGDQLFIGDDGTSTPKNLKPVAPANFNILNRQSLLVVDSFSSNESKNGITIISSKRGGDISASTHCEWLLTVPSMPDVINFTFIPITSLLSGIPGMGFLSHAINLYLRYKPPMADLKYFLGFQAVKIWVPIHNIHSELSLGPATKMAMQMPALRFKLIGPTLYVNTTQVTVGKKPVTGMRLYLEGTKSNRLAIHLEHLSDTPQFLQNTIDDALIWRGSEEFVDDRYLEAIQWKRFSHICAAPVKYDPNWVSISSNKNVTFIVAGAQIHVKKHNSKSVLHLRLLYSKVSDSSIVQSNWVQCPSDLSQDSGFFSSLSSSVSSSEKEVPKREVVVDSAVYPGGPPVQVRTRKLLKFVDMSELCRGPMDSPGHWLVTGAKLELEKGKICLSVKFSLLNMIV